MPSELSVYDPNPDYDGSFRLTLTDRENKPLHTIDIPDVEAFNTELLKTLADDEKTGMAFRRAVVRFIFAKFGIRMSVHAAIQMYAAIVKVMQGADDFFTNPPDSAGSTDVVPPTSGAISESPSSEVPSPASPAS